MIFDGFVHQLPDTDPDRDARVARLARCRHRRPGQDPRPVTCSAKLLERARRAAGQLPGHGLDAPTSTPSRREQEPWFPGDEYIERRIRAYIRWNAAVMVIAGQQEGRRHRRPPRRRSPRRRALYEIGFNHFFRGKDDGNARRPRLHPGPRRARHLRPGLPRGPPHRGRSSTTSAGGRPRRPRSVQLPAPPADARLLGVPDGVDGPRPALARSTRPASTATCTTAQQDDTSASRVWAFLGDGETDEPESLGALSLAAREQLDNLDLRRQLQPAAPRRPGPRQRQDHPGAGGRCSAAPAGT